MSTNWYKLGKDHSYSFELLRGDLNADEPSRQFFGNLLYDGLLEVGYVEQLLDRFGLKGVAAFLASRGFVGKLSTRVGDFGEVLAGSLLQFQEIFEQPISKLRYREKSSWNMRLTDVFAFEVVEGQIESFCFASVKSGTTPPSGDVGVSGYGQLIDDAQVEHPEILWFVSEQLYREQKFEELSMLNEAAFATAPIPNKYRLIFVFDSGAWKEEVLINLNSAFQHELLDFKTYLLVCPSMKEVVEESYKIATGRCYGE